MTLLLAASLVLVALSGAVVLTTKSALAQAVVLSVHGLVLTVAFVAFGAPDVALAQLGIGAAVVPLMVLLALAKTRVTSEPTGARSPRAPGPGRDDPTDPPAGGTA